ncbi:DNA cytosine methyltransferase [Sedimentibacter saalensis]|uniref:Cytosine-specific methyltransferase n=1 Tax=Sedimentibacter saalensis TaxID=130788 RepID=A0A562JH71_9FIRM|nr:DNA cytosine methyltransferase [Sedimentibacter saalensis]TWH82577.1 DNA (cytosine-5)-methyltransferase 1 [Sedimentibacter saalensis]
MDKPKVLDMFCGCGGLSLGFINAGYDVVLGVDNDEAALKTYEINHQEAIPLKADLFTDEAINEIKDVIDKKIGTIKNIDVIIGGPPCQGFSLTGSRDINDSRNKLYLAMVKVIRLVRPKSFLIENVHGIATLYGGVVKDQIVNTFTDMGYKVSVTPKPLLAADYGVPQMRKRMFFVGIRNDVYESKGEEFSFPVPTHSSSNYISCSDAISDLPSRESELGSEIDEYIMNPQTDYQRFMRINCEKLYNHVATNHTDMVKSTIELVPDGGNYKDLPKGYGESRKFNEAWTRYASNKPSRTIDTGHRNHFHYKYNRVPTIRENARLQSFPDSFIFWGNKTQQNRQVGNAVPPLLAYSIAVQLKKYLQLGEKNE